MCIYMFTNYVAYSAGGKRRCLVAAAAHDVVVVVHSSVCPGLFVCPVRVRAARANVCCFIFRVCVQHAMCASPFLSDVPEC